MKKNDDDFPIITRQLVPDDQRMATVETLFGLHFPLHLEPVIYGITEWMTQGQYCGGYWLFYALTNGGFYMASDDEQVFTVSCDNHWQGQLSPDALGIVACLYAYSHLSFSPDEKFARVCARHYHWLREYMYDHAEVTAILGAID